MVNTILMSYLSAGNRIPQMLDVTLLLQCGYTDQLTD